MIVEFYYGKWRNLLVENHQQQWRSNTRVIFFVWASTVITQRFSLVEMMITLLSMISKRMFFLFVLFKNKIILTNIDFSGTAVDVFLHEKPVYGLSIDPLNDQIFSSAGEDGRILVFDLRLSSEVMCVAKYRSPFHAVNFHPMDGSLIITANAKEGAGLWDLRKPKKFVFLYF